MIASRFSAVWQVAGVAAAALCCYLASQTVAGERAALAKIDRQIARAQDDIGRLTTEIGTRSRMGQLERWNSEVLALQAPRPRQFVANGVQLASLYGRYGHETLPLDPAIVASKGAVDTVSYQPAKPAAPDARPTPSTHVERAVPVPVAAPAPVEQPLLRQATFVRPKATRLAEDEQSVVRVSMKTSGSLLPADIGKLAAIEKAGKTARKRDDR